MTTAHPKRIGMYIRVSTDEQSRSGLGMEAQRAACMGLAALHGFSIVGEYVDAGVSACAKVRPAWIQLVTDLRGGVLDGMVVFCLDRLFRSMADIAFWLLDTELGLFTPTTGLRLFVVKEGFDNQSPVGRLMIGLIGAFAEFERSLVSERTRAAYKARAVRRYGEHVVPKQLAAEASDWPYASVIARMAALELRGYGLTLQEIADELTSRKIQSERAATSPRARGWNIVKVHRYLQRPVSPQALWAWEEARRAMRAHFAQVPSVLSSLDDAYGEVTLEGDDVDIQKAVGRDARGPVKRKAKTSARLRLRRRRGAPEA